MCVSPNQRPSKLGGSWSRLADAYEAAGKPFRCVAGQEGCGRAGHMKKDEAEHLQGGGTNW